MKLVFATLLFILSASGLFAQKYGRQLIDSLQTELPKAKEDSNKVLLLVSISDCYYFHFDSALCYAQKADGLAEKLGWDAGIALTNKTLGDAYYMGRNYASGLLYYFKALKMYEDRNDKENEKVIMIQVVNLYLSRRDYSKAIEYATKKLELDQSSRNDNNICAGLWTLAQVYMSIPAYPKALEHLFRALDIYKKNGNKFGTGLTEMNIGNCYSQQGNYSNALQYDFMSLKMGEETHDTNHIKTILKNIGTIYSFLHDDSSALAYYNKIIIIDEQAGDKNSVANDYYPLIAIYLKLHNYSKALEYGFNILKSNEQTDTANIKYALGEIGMIYFRIATDSTTPAKADKLIPYGKTANLMKARGYFIQSGIRPKLLVFLNGGSSTETADYFPQLIETQRLLGDYKGAFENLKIAKALGDTLSSQTQQKLISNLEVTQATADIEKQAAIDKIAKIKKQNERIFSFVGVGLLLLIMVVVYRNYLAQKKSNKIITREKKRSDDLLLNILPSEVAEELKEKGSAAAKYFDHVTVLFTDFVGFTKAGEQMSPQDLVDELDVCFKGFDGIIEKYGIEKIKTIGDAYLAVSGLPAENSCHAEDIVSAALDIRDFMLQRKQQLGEKTFEVRIGIHSGSVVAGIVGVKKFAYDIWGDTVNTAARMEQNSEGGKVNISRETYELVKDKFACTYRGDITAKNKGEMSMYFVER